MGASNNQVNWQRGPAVPRDDREAAPAPTEASLTTARIAAMGVRQTDLTATAAALNWREATCEAILADGQGWPACPQPDVLKMIIDLIDADAQARDAAATLQRFQDRPEAA